MLLQVAFTRCVFAFTGLTLARKAVRHQTPGALRHAGRNSRAPKEIKIEIDVISCHRYTVFVLRPRSNLNLNEKANKRTTCYCYLAIAFEFITGTSNYRQIWPPRYPMNFVVLSKIA